MAQKDWLIGCLCLKPPDPWLSAGRNGSSATLVVKGSRRVADRWP